MVSCNILNFSVEPNELKRVSISIFKLGHGQSLRAWKRFSLQAALREQVEFSSQLAGCMQHGAEEKQQTKGKCDL